MRVVRNTGHIKTRQRAARVTAWAGGLALLAAIAVPFILPSLILPAYALMILGFIAFNTGMQQVHKWNQRPRSDELIDDALRRLNDRYTLIHFPAPLNGHPEHLLVGPNGLLAITTRRIQGDISVKDNKWHRAGGSLWFLIAMGTPQLGNPTAENERERRALASFLESKGLAGADDIDGLIAFLPPPRNEVKVDVISSDITVVLVDKLFGAVRQQGGDSALTKQQRDEIVEALSQGDNVEGPVTLSARPERARRARAA